MFYSDCMIVLYIGKICNKSKCLLSSRFKNIVWHYTIIIQLSLFRYLSLLLPQTLPSSAHQNCHRICILCTSKVIRQLLIHWCKLQSPAGNILIGKLEIYIFKILETYSLIFNTMSYIP